MLVNKYVFLFFSVVSVTVAGTETVSIRQRREFKHIKKNHHIRGKVNNFQSSRTS